MNRPASKAIVLCTMGMALIELGSTMGMGSTSCVGSSMSMRSTIGMGPTMGKGPTNVLQFLPLVICKRMAKEMMMMKMTKHANCRPVASPPVKKILLTLNRLTCLWFHSSGTFSRAPVHTFVEPELATIQ